MFFGGICLSKLVTDDKLLKCCWSCQTEPFVRVTDAQKGQKLYHCASILTRRVYFQLTWALWPSGGSRLTTCTAGLNASMCAAGTVLKAPALFGSSIEWQMACKVPFKCATLVIIMALKCLLTLLRLSYGLPHVVVLVARWFFQSSRTSGQP